MIKPIEWLGDRVRILDQTRLPAQRVYIETSDYRVVADAIRRLCVRGAPSIGVAGAYGAALAGLHEKATSYEDFGRCFERAATELRMTRPTAVNLAWAIEQVEAAAKDAKTVHAARDAIVQRAIAIERGERDATERLSRLGAQLIQDGYTVLTHCNAGPLATCGCGTALGVIIMAKQMGKQIKAYATETRPLLQGARLTALELVEEGIPVTLIADSMAGHFLSKGCINAVIVGADRIAANGDTANKIGTYSLAVLASANDVPFYVAAPTSTIDLSAASGAAIPIEDREPGEVTHFAGVRVAAEGVEVANPAFDVTPAALIDAIITERGIVTGPYALSLSQLFGTTAGGEDNE